VWCGVVWLEVGCTGDNAYVSEAVVIEGDLQGQRAVQVACGAEHTMVLTDEGRLYTWGRATYGRLGHGESDRTCVDTPRRVDLGEKVRVRKIAAGSHHSALLTDEGDLVTFGWGKYGRLGHSNEYSTYLPKKVPWPPHLSTSTHTVPPDDAKEEVSEEAGSVVDFSCGNNNTALLTDKGRVWMCGWGRYGILGTTSANANANASTPQLVTSISSVVSVRCGGFHVSALVDG